MRRRLRSGQGKPPGQPLRRCLIGAIAGLGLASLSGCNHLFYYPDALQRMTPADVELRFTSHTVATADGERLAVWHIKPGRTPRHMTLVHFHGNAGNMTSHFMYVAWLAEIGFDVITFDYRGYGTSTGTPSRVGLVRDGAAVLDWVRQQPSLRQPLAVFGQSLGGAVAVPAVAVRPAGEVRGLAVEGTFDSYRAITRGKLGSLWLTWPLQYPLSFLVSDDESAGDFAARLKMPFLVIHADDDPVVPFRYGLRLYERATAAPKELWKITSAVHTGVFVEAESPERPRLVAFFCRVGGIVCPDLQP